MEQEKTELVPALVERAVKGDKAALWQAIKQRGWVDLKGRNDRKSCWLFDCLFYMSKE